jgi:5-methylcytosine-specific restriction endonuclease McrA
MYNLPVYAGCDADAPEADDEAPAGHYYLALLRQRRQGLDRELERLAGAVSLSAARWRSLVSRVCEEQRRIDLEVAHILAGGPPRRPPRQIPSLTLIAAFHGLGPVPHCVRCRRTAPGSWRAASRHLERAHIIDRIFDGLDTEQNLLPLCSSCHRAQPGFRPGEEVRALLWFGRPAHPWAP